SAVPRLHHRDRVLRLRHAALLPDVVAARGAQGRRDCPPALMRPAAPTRSSPGARAHSLSQWAADRAQGLVRLLHRVIPKRNQAVLYGWPDFEDTVLALEPLLQDGPLNRVVMLVDGVDGPRPPLGPRTVVLAKR